MKFRIVTLDDNDIDENDPDCLMTAFKFMLENVDDGTRWMGSEDRLDCVEYVANHIDQGEIID